MNTFRLQISLNSMRRLSLHCYYEKFADTRNVNRITDNTMTNEVNKIKIRRPTKICKRPEHK